ncbi:autotransporter outer membrane beta-barrel domain-containing protein [uncultured Ferrovibrio sp.]|uniref:autotransporter family protein n=1 Tax=uncultured Ferrovibrio sp. TaxID=1576913 RepID=UPI002601A2C6|nr:autotransporter outer membrane beta-barrel domain-containing protein [uncultured Ferrovibrio sp.]
MIIGFCLRVAPRNAMLSVRNAALAGTALTALYALPASAAPLCGASVGDGVTLNCDSLIAGNGLDIGGYDNVTVNVSADWINNGPLISGNGGTGIQLNIGSGVEMSTSGGPLISLGQGSGKIVVEGTLTNEGTTQPLISLEGGESNHYEIFFKPSAVLNPNGGLILDSTARVTVETSNFDLASYMEARTTKDTFRASKEMTFLEDEEVDLDNFIKSDNSGFEIFEFADGNWNVSRSSGGPKRDLRVTGGMVMLLGEHNADVDVAGGFFGASATNVVIKGNLTVSNGKVRTFSDLAVGGNVVFKSGTAYSPVIAYTAGRLVVGGSASIAKNTTLELFPGLGLFSDGSFSILTAAKGITGKFSTIELYGGQTIAASASYTANEITVKLGTYADPDSDDDDDDDGGNDNVGGGGGHSGQLVPAATTASGTAAAAVLDAARGNSQLTNLIAVLDALPPAQKAAALTSLSGQTTTTMAAMPTVSAASVVSTVLNHNTAQPGATAPTRFGGTGDSADAGRRSGISTGDASPDHGAWVSVLGGFGSVDAKNGIAGSDTRTGGFAGGLDFALEPERVTAGVSFGYVGSRTEIDNDGGTADAKAGFLDLYGRLEDWGIRLDGTLMGGRHYGEQSRTVTLGVATATAKGENDGWSLGAGLQVSTGLEVARSEDVHAVLRPFAGVTAQRYWQGAFTESGAETANLRYGSFTRDSFVSRVGASWEFDIQAGKETRLSPMVSLGWAHQFAADAPRMDAAFALLPDARFSVTGAEMERDSLEIGLGLDVIDLGEGLTFSIGYGGSLARDAQDHTFSGRAKIAL